MNLVWEEAFDVPNKLSLTPMLSWTAIDAGCYTRLEEPVVNFAASSALFPLTPQIGAVEVE